MSKLTLLNKDLLSGDKSLFINMRKTILVLSFVLGFSIFALGVSAASIFDIEFPISELGNCADKAACKEYCNDPANGEACLAFAKKFGLADESTVAKIKKADAGGPGGCKGAEGCRVYCDDSAHEEECIDFAVQNGFMSKEEAERIRKPGPGGCRGRACEAYCHDPAHEEECFEYAADNGLIPPGELKRIKEFKNKFKRSEGGPGGCKSEQECRSFCNDPANIEACLSFAEEQGFVSKEEATRVKKAGFAGGPGGCRGHEECRQYCGDPSHQNECIDFGEKNGFMTKEEAERARKFAGKTGPGGCRGEECRTFCDNPANSEQCLEHAAKEGLIPPEELERARKFLKASQEGGPGGCHGAQCRDYCSDPSHQEECFSFAKNQGLLRPEDEENFEVGQKLNKKLQESGGPGGCKAEEECRVYCTDASHTEECVAFAAAHGGVPPEQARAMLRQFTEQRFNAGGPGEFGPPQDFRRFEEEGQRRFEEFRQLEGQFRGPGGPGFPGGPGGFGPPGGFPGPGEFPGGPGGFPGGPGGPGEQGGGHVGPGGCTSPQECIKYCTDHRDECFGPSSSGPGGPSDRGDSSRGGFPGEGFGPPQLRSGLLQEFKPGELPEDFHQKPFEERQQFFQERFGPPPGSEGGGFPGRPGEFPGQGGHFPENVPSEFPGRPGQFEGSREFPGAPGEFPGRPGQFEGSKEFPGTPGQFPGNPEGGFPQNFQRPEGSSFPRPPEGSFPPPPGGGFTQPGTSGEFQQQFAPPPAGSFEHPPAGTFGGEQSPSGGTFTPPPTGTFQQPPPSSGGTFSPPSTGTFESQPPPPPPSSGVRKGFFASIIDFFRAK